MPMPKPKPKPTRHRMRRRKRTTLVCSTNTPTHQHNDYNDYSYHTFIAYKPPPQHFPLCVFVTCGRLLLLLLLACFFDAWNRLLFTRCYSRDFWWPFIHSSIPSVVHLFICSFFHANLNDSTISIHTTMDGATELRWKNLSHSFFISISVLCEHSKLVIFQCVRC